MIATARMVRKSGLLRPVLPGDILGTRHGMNGTLLFLVVAATGEQCFIEEDEFNSQRLLTISTTGASGQWSLYNNFMDDETFFTACRVKQ